jgi:hypothetical protein
MIDIIQQLSWVLNLRYNARHIFQQVNSYHLMAEFDLEALVGHLFIVGGRVISSPSPGSVATPSPRRAARGRDTDTLFSLITMSEETHQPAAFYEKLASDFSAKYFSTPGSLTSALREAIGTLNNEVRAANSGLSEPLSIGVVCSILREQELIIATVGPVRCLIVHKGSVQRLPGDTDVSEGMRPLGVDGDPDIRLYRHEAEPGDFLIAGGSMLNRVKDSALLTAVEDGSVEAVLTSLRANAGEMATADVIKFVAPESDGQAGRAQPSQTGQAVVSASTPAEPAAATGAAVMDEPVDPGSLTPTRRMGRSAALTMAKLTSELKRVAGRIMPSEPIDNPLEDNFQLSPVMQFGVAIAMAVLVALVTIGVYRWRGETSQYGQLIRQARTEIGQARAGGTDQAVARPHWETAIFLLDQASLIRAPGSDAATMRAEALAALDAYDHVTRVNPVLLREYAPGTVLRGPIVQGLNLYLIDTTNDILYREDLDQNSTALVNRDPQVLTRLGELLNNQPVGGLIDLAWMEEGGVPQRNVLAVVARNGLFITYSPSWATTASVLPGFEGWQDPRAIAVYNKDLYILDAGANEIWRYQESQQAYASLPQRYFTDQIPPLGDAVDMEIDTNGNVYILHTDGRITKFFFGREQQFVYEGLPQPVSTPASFSLSLGLLDRAFFIADKGGGRIFQIAPNGSFLTNFKDTDNTIFLAVSGAYSQDRPPIVYLTAGNRLYYFPRPQ